MSDSIGKLPPIGGPAQASGLSAVNRVTRPITTGRPGIPHIPEAQPGKSFQELLQTSLAQRQAQTLTFSRHAQQRVEQRGVALSGNDMSRLSRAVEQAGQKGITDSLVFMNDTAFIVNIPNRVVVTVVDSGDTEHNVFTNINGAVIV